MQYNKSLFIFRRDLRLSDNTALNAALKNSKIVIPCFIFDPRQVSDKNHYYSANAIQFMIESLLDLDKQLQEHKSRLYYFYGKAEDVVADLLKNGLIDAVYVNKDYTPFSIKRDAELEKNCVHYGKDFQQYDDLLLHEPSLIKTKNEAPFTVYTPFYKKAVTVNVENPQKLIGKNFYKSSLKGEHTWTVYDFIKHENPSLAVHGGTTVGKKILSSLKKFQNYAQERDYPAIATTHLSAHNKFGTVSIREVYYAISKELGSNHPLLRQLYWRDFFTIVAYYSPFVFGQPFREKYRALSWSDDRGHFKRWCEGITGFPIVDAAMRELNQTGFMHNRARLIVSSFLIKDLQINWLWGEKYFAQHLVDYDPCVNNGNWQWSASTGCDSQPYFRIFNPWLQQKKFDPECIYIKRWVPELKNVSNAVIHSWYKQKQVVKNYPLPMVDHEIETKRTKLMYKKAVYG